MIRNQTLMCIIMILCLTNATEIQNLLNKIKKTTKKYKISGQKSIYEYKKERDYIGHGSFGAVYRGEDTEKNQVAIKQIKHTRTGTAKYYFETEVKMLKKLNMLANHNNILKLIDHTPLDSVERDNYYIVTEYCAGSTLFDRLDKYDRFSEETTKAYLEQIIHGLLYMRNGSIVHRDLKLENILLLYKDFTTIKLIDFGLSYDCTKKQGDLKGGTRGYMAPEQYSKNWNAEKLCSEKKVDVWSLGVMLYTMLSGNYPYKMSIDQEPMNTTEILSSFNFSYSFDEPVWENVSDNAKDLVVQMLTIDPQKRISLHDIFDHSWYTHKQKKKVILK